MVVRALRESDHKVTMLTGMYVRECMDVCMTVSNFIIIIIAIIIIIIITDIFVY